MLRIKNKKTGSSHEVTEEKWEELKKLGWNNYWHVEKETFKEITKKAKKYERERLVVQRIDENTGQDGGRTEPNDL